VSEPAPLEYSFLSLPDLACEAVGGAALATNDEFFAEKENLLRAHAAEWREHEYTDRGKWMDGWETRRRREPGYDWCVIEDAGQLRHVCYYFQTSNIAMVLRHPHRSVAPPEFSRRASGTCDEQSRRLTAWSACSRRPSDHDGIRPPSTSS
jgi:allantoicase